MTPASAAKRLAAIEAEVARICPPPSPADERFTWLGWISDAELDELEWIARPRVRGKPLVATADVAVENLARARVGNSLGGRVMAGRDSARPLRRELIWAGCTWRLTPAPVRAHRGAACRGRANDGRCWDSRRPGYAEARSTFVGQAEKHRTVAGPVLYSTNPTFAHLVATRYRGGAHVVWASEEFDPLAAGSAAPHGLIGGRSASPRDIFEELSRDCQAEERHSPHIQRYRKTFRRLAKVWLAANEIDASQYAEIVSLLREGWNVWRPLLYVIPRAPIEAAGRLVLVPPARRATNGPEYQIELLMPDEFDILRWVPR